jgi:hypothetical protein
METEPSVAVLAERVDNGGSTGVYVNGVSGVVNEAEEERESDDGVDGMDGWSDES